MSSIEIVVHVGGMSFAVSFAVNLMDDHQHKTGTEIFCLWRGELCSYLVIKRRHRCGNHQKVSDKFQPSLFRSVIVQSGFL